MNKTISNIEEKPFNLCLDCALLGKKCDGPNFLSMSVPRRAEWCRLRKNNLYMNDKKWTNDYIAEITGLSRSSVDRFFRGEIKDIRASTLSMMLKLLINDVDGSWKHYPCPMDNMDADEEERNIVKKLESECDRLRNIIDADEEKKQFLAEQIKIKDAQMAEKDIQMKERADFLRRKDKGLALLSILLILAIITIIILLI